MKATTSRRRIRKSSPKCSAESTRCCRVSLRKCRNHGPRRRSAAPIPLYPPERMLDRIFDRVVGRTLARWEPRNAACETVQPSLLDLEAGRERITGYSEIGHEPH